jgi:predicted PurR-regulated permease PerM
VVRVVLTGLTAALGFGMLVIAAYVVRSIIVLVIVAVFLAVGLDPAVRWLERHRLKRGQAVAAIFLALLAFIGGFAALIVPTLVSQVTHFATNLPHYVQDLAAHNPRIHDFVVKNNISQRLSDATHNAPSIIAGSLGGVLGVAGSVVSSIFKVVTVSVLAIYFSLSLSSIREGTLRLVPRTHRARTAALMDPILEKIGGYIAGNIAVSVIAGVLAAAFLAIARVPFPIALGLWVAIADLIPLVGATLGAVPAVLVAFFAGVPVGIATVVYFIVYQQVENYVIAPRVMTRAVDISAAAVLLAALIGASLLGFVGALMAIPAAASIKLIFHEVILPRIEAA